jgi:ribonuclease Z
VHAPASQGNGELERLQLGELELEALSIGGIETCIHVPRWKLAFDVGRAPRGLIPCPTVLFTHDRSELEHATVPLGPGQEHVLPNKLLVRPFRSLHVVPCQGYGIWSRREKLRPEFAGLSGEDLRRLRGQGRKVTDTLETPELAFTGDTLIEVVEREEVVRRARVLIIECTFVGDEIDVAQARSRGHVHLDEIAERAGLFENEHLLLTHFSARFSAGLVRAELERKLPSALRERVVPLLGAHG